MYIAWNWFYVWLVGCLCSQTNLLKIKNKIARPVCVIFDGIKLILTVSQLLQRTEPIPYRPYFIYTRVCVSCCSLHGLLFSCTFINRSISLSSLQIKSFFSFNRATYFSWTRAPIWSQQSIYGGRTDFLGFFNEQMVVLDCLIVLPMFCCDVMLLLYLFKIKVVIETQKIISVV